LQYYFPAVLHSNPIKIGKGLGKKEERRKEGIGREARRGKGG
jgi:hypothetical protein